MKINMGKIKQKDKNVNVGKEKKRQNSNFGIFFLYWLGISVPLEH